MARFLVTGGAGFIGSHIVSRLVSDGNRVRVLDNLCAGSLANLAHLGNSVEFHEGDVRDPLAVAKAVDGELSAVDRLEQRRVFLGPWP